MNIQLIPANHLPPTDRLYRLDADTIIRLRIRRVDPDQREDGAIEHPSHVVYELQCAPCDEQGDLERDWERRNILLAAERHTVMAVGIEGFDLRAWAENLITEAIHAAAAKIALIRSAHVENPFDDVHPKAK